MSGGRAVGVRLEDGTTVRARKAVLADVAAPSLYRDLVGAQHLPARFMRDLDTFQWDNPTLKVNWALDRPLPWRAERGPRRRAPCTSVWTPTGSSTSRPTCRWAGCRSGRSCCSGR